MSEIKPFFEQPLSEEELSLAVDAPIEEQKWRHEATNAVAIQRLITELVDKISELENRESFVREQGEEKPGEHDEIVAQLRNYHNQLDAARVIEENILHKLESAGKNIDDANFEMATVPEETIESTKDELLGLIADIGNEQAAQEAARKKIANIDEPFHDEAAAA